MDLLEAPDNRALQVSLEFLVKLDRLDGQEFLDPPVRQVQVDLVVQLAHLVLWDQLVQPDLEDLLEVRVQWVRRVMWGVQV